MSNIIEKVQENTLSINIEEIEKYANEYLETKLSHLSPKMQKQFLSMCCLHRLNPFKREIHATIRYNPTSKEDELVIVTGYETYLKRAQASGLYAGHHVEYDKSEPANPIAIATVYRLDKYGNKHAIIEEVAFLEYAQRTKEGKLTKFWKEKPRTMLRKVALSQAFRRGFADFIDGLPYTTEEMNIENDKESFNLNNLSDDEADKLIESVTNNTGWSGKLIESKITKNNGV